MVEPSKIGDLGEDVIDDGCSGRDVGVFLLGDDGAGAPSPVKVAGEVGVAASEDTEEGSFADAVTTDEADFFAVGDGDEDVLEEFLSAEGFFVDVGVEYHGLGSF